MDNGARKAIIAFWAALMIPISFIIILGVGQCTAVQGDRKSCFRAGEFWVCN